MGACAICLELMDTAAGCHPACCESLFGTPNLPTFDVSVKELYKIAVQMTGKMSISGLQEKVSLKLSEDKTKLLAAVRGGQYILKPESGRFPALPANEHVTMHLAAAAGIEVPAFGLLRLRDESPAYVIRRFDRTDDGSKLRVEDFAQLSARPVRDKYDGSAELCVRILGQYASEPLVQIRRLYKLLLFAWWAANGDLHLKNFSLLTGTDGIRRLSPAYDLVCTQLVIPDDPLALSVVGKKKNLRRQTWFDFAEYCKLPERAAQRIIDEQIRTLAPALGLIATSFLPDEMKDEFRQIIQRNTAVLAG